MVRRFLFGVAVALVLAGAASAQALHVDVLIDNLENPWGLAFLPDGRMLMTERAGRLWILDAQGKQLAAVRNVPPVFVMGQGGLFDVVLDPAFATNSIVYLSLAHGDLAHNDTRVIRARLDGDALADVKPAFDAKDKATAAHFGGRLAFLRDGTLLVTVGEGAEYREDAQRLGELRGKIVRIETDGSAPKDNPFVGKAGADPRVYSYGHRNEQGLFVDTDGTIYETEHGPMGGDELNVIRPGRNYGWPIATHGLDYTGGRISPFETYPGMTEAIRFWVPSPATGGVAIYHGALFPQWEGDALVCALAFQHLKVVDLQGGRVTGEVRLLEDRKARFRQVKVAPDGAILALIDAVDGKERSGQLLRITPAQ